MTEIRNYTPHEVKIKVGDEMRVYPSLGIARVATTSKVVGEVCGIPVNTTEYGEVVGLPEKEEGVYYIVSALVLNASTRDDLVVPDGCVRNEAGQVDYCTALKNK